MLYKSHLLSYGERERQKANLVNYNWIKELIDYLKGEKNVWREGGDPEDLWSDETIQGEAGELKQPHPHIEAS